MDFLRYADQAAALVNAEPADPEALIAHLADREWLHEQVTPRDVRALRAFCGRLRAVFEASEERRVADVVAGLNELLVEHPVTPVISDHDGVLHLHVADRSASVADLLVGEALMGLATLVCDLGPTRLGVCSAAPCRRVYVDTSPNASRRYCSERCSSRANVAAFRARRRAAVGGPA
ncbi:CGNR zinc finger domain-containing protein [Nocardioides solisilvae]|uniref:CGNR zinc finger domain-containing protein n=1 Tax=Nocardioides solisilvae TaxID=1542435 RepID=UPI000D745FB6|nr:CGNR zinc finger domain-containing protein [Nocardioides solisilvae]